MKCADRIAEFFKEQGCTHAFGFVGGANLTLFQAIGRKMEMVCVHHEQAASMAAAAHFQLCGRIAPVLVTAGAGAMNCLTGVMSANMNGIPLFILSGNEKSIMFNTTSKRCIGFQGFNPVDVVGSFTKSVVSADNPLGAVLAAQGLYKTALEHRQGPVWCDVPQDIALMEVE